MKTNVKNVDILNKVDLICSDHALIDGHPLLSCTCVCVCVYTHTVHRLSGGLKMCGREGMMTDFTEHHRSETITKRSSIDFAITSIPFRCGSLGPVFYSCSSFLLFFFVFLDGENPTQSLYQVGGSTQFITPNPNDCPGPLSTYLNLKGDSPLAEYPLRPRSSSCGPTNGTPPPRTTLRTI